MSTDDLSRSSTEQKGLLHDDIEAEGHQSSFANGSAYSQARLKKALRQHPPWLRPKCIWIGLAVAVVLILGSIMWLQKSNIIEQILPKPPTASKSTGTSKSENPSYPISSPLPPTASLTNAGRFEKPKNFKIIGLVFYGRPQFVAVLDCYLKRNLVVNGGFLDEVHFAVHTDKKEDITWLDNLVTTSDLYKKITIPEGGYNIIWQHTVESGPMYIKIDDDMVFFDDNAIPSLVKSKLDHPDAFNIVANLVNSPETGWLHYHFGAIHSYLPETVPPDPNTDSAALGPKAWRASALPFWNEDKEMGFPVTVDKSDDGSVLEADNPAAPPFKGHRWLPLRDSKKNIYKTPIAESQYNAYGPDWKSWALAAQVHYSLLENIEKDQLYLYHYGTSSPNSSEGIWNTAFDRMNINFMAIWGKDVVDNPFDHFDDEHQLSIEIPRRLGRPVLVNTHAVAAHLSFRPQHEVYDTDLLDRYRAYANEKICTKNNQITIPRDR